MEGGIASDVPWGNLWRWIVTTALFFLLIGFTIAVFTELDRSETASMFQLVVFMISATLAAIVVWSDAIPWPG